jgi:hypothetical protein
MEKLVRAFSSFEVWPPYDKNSKPRQYGTMNPTGLNAKRLIAKLIIKSPFMIDEELHGHYLKLDTCIADQLPFLAIPF